MSRPLDGDHLEPVRQAPGEFVEVVGFHISRQAVARIEQAEQAIAQVVATSRQVDQIAFGIKISRAQSSTKRS